MTRMERDLSRIGSAVRERFEAQKRVLSFREYLDLFFEHPWRHTRDAARYMKDCFDYFGSYELERPWGKLRRWRLFDQPFEHPVGPATTRRSDHLVANEAIQNSAYLALSNFAQEGRANRLLLLHGPNGSAKSTFVGCVMRALEHYSGVDEGAVYRFSWVFPRGRDGRGGIGFGSSDDPAGDTFAHLPEDRIDVKLRSELREHPLLLLPEQERQGLVTQAYSEAHIEAAAPDWIWTGELGHKNESIFQALLKAYRGDLDRVLAHVQVERYYLSRYYRIGAVTIGPEMAVDAHERQITADHSLRSLPASLSALTLYEPFGELVDASGGMIEYSDLLKRPLDAWKYLLLAIETGEVSLQHSNIAINAVMMASSNELHLTAFREHHEYNSFRGRIHFIQMPYLLDAHQEQAIYDSQIVPQVRQHVAPHATFVAALWAVLTRLRRPRADWYDEPALGRLAAELTPMEKAELYAEGAVPPRLSSEEDKVLRNGAPDIFQEGAQSAEREGMTGASPREIRNLLLEAAHDERYVCLSPLAILDRIDAFCERNDYAYLKQTPDRGYYDHMGFVSQVRDKWLDRVDAEVRSATGLVSETQYIALFDRYVTHISFWIKNERVYNRVTESYEDPDTEFMASVERMLDVDEDAEEFRHHVIGAVAGYAIDKPGEKVDYSRVFPRYIDRLRSSYFAERRKQVRSLMLDMLKDLRNEDGLTPERQTQARNAVEVLKRQFGYESPSIQDAVSELLRIRYTD